MSSKKVGSGQCAVLQVKVASDQWPVASGERHLDSEDINPLSSRPTSAAIHNE